MDMENKIYILLLLFIFCSQLIAQESILDNYVKTGLENNLALQQKKDSYEKSLYALREARGMFLPTLSLNARYTVADGGRLIEFPVGDMLNPVYSNLNALNDMVYAELPPELQPADFPLIDNQSFAFYRPKEHETKVQMVMPLFNSQIYYNNKIKKDLVNIEKADAATYERYLVAEIKTAYFNYLKTVRVLELLDDTYILLEENIRVNEKLFENDMVTSDVVYRSKTELSKLQQQHAEAEKYNKSAQAWFNFLLNRNADADIEIDRKPDILVEERTYEDAEVSAVQNREELDMADHYITLTNDNMALSWSNRMPYLILAVDYGFQGEKYSFTSDDDFVFASLVLRWDLFKGLQNSNKYQQALIDKNIAETRRTEIESQVRLQVINAWYDLQASEKAVIASTHQAESAEKAFKVINRKYKEGQVSLLEYIDARTTMTNAKQNMIITKYDYYSKCAELEKVAALYDIKSY